MLFNTGTERIKPSPYRMTQGNSRVVVRSVGRSGVGLVRSLRQVMLLAEADIAALLLQAPSTLITGMARSVADDVAALLRDSGLDCAVLDDHADCEDGSGDFDVALQIQDFSQISGIILEVMHLLGVDFPTASKLVCAVPAPLLGSVSAATVAALQTRFAPLGAEIIASPIPSARFDLFLGVCSPTLHERIAERLRFLAEDIRLDLTDGGLLANLDHQQTAQALRELRALAVPVRVVNRDFARYALILQRGNDTPALRDCLERWGKMPAAVVPRVLANLPIAINQNLTQDETETALAELTDLGAAAVAEPLALQRFAIALEPVRDTSAVQAILRDIGGQDEATVQTTLRSHKPYFPGPFGATQARWLLHELRRAGVSAKLESL